MPGNCSEAQAAQAAGNNNSPRKNYQTVWAGPGENPYPLPGQPTPPNAIVIGVYGLSGECVLLFPGSEGSIPADAAEPTVAFSTIGQILYVCAQTFRNHIYNQAVALGKITGGSLFSLRREDAAFLQEATQARESLGFHSYWFSDDYVVSLERDDRAVIQIVRAPSRTTLYGRFPAHNARNDLRSFLIRHYDLTDNIPNAPLSEKRRTAVANWSVFYNAEFTFHQQSLPRRTGHIVVR